MQITSSTGGSNAAISAAQPSVRASEAQQAGSAPEKASPEETAGKGFASKLSLESSLIEKLILYARADASLAAYADREQTAPSPQAVAASYGEF